MLRKKARTDGGEQSEENKDSTTKPSFDINA